MDDVSASTSVKHLVRIESAAATSAVPPPFLARMITLALLCIMSQEYTQLASTLS